MYFICKYILPACLYMYHMHSQESQKTASDALELGLGTVVRGYVGAGSELKSSASDLTIEPSPSLHKIKSSSVNTQVRRDHGSHMVPSKLLWVFVLKIFL